MSVMYTTQVMTVALYARYIPMIVSINSPMGGPDGCEVGVPEGGKVGDPVGDPVGGEDGWATG